MSDWYRDFANSGFGTTVTKQLGLPRPAVLRRYEPGEPLLPGPGRHRLGGGGPAARTADRRPPGRRRDGAVAGHAPTARTDGEKLGAVILDATGLSTPADLASAHDFLAPAIKRLRAIGAGADPGRPAVRGRLPGAGRRPPGAGRTGPLHRQGAPATARRRTSSTCPRAPEGSIASPVRFFLSGRSAYVDGQVVTLSAAELPGRRGRREAAGRQGRRRHRGRPRHRRLDRRGHGPGRRARRGRRHPRGRRQAGRGRQRDRRDGAAARHHRRRRRRSG